MTCVIALGGRRGFICADRRITSSAGERCPSQRKVWRGDGMVVAGAGSAGALGRIRRLVLGGCADPLDLIDPCGDHTHVLCLLPSGRLVEVSEGDVWAVRSPLRCIGSGGDLARGYLEGRRVTEASARAAQAVVARLRDDCGGGVDVERLPKRPRD